MIAAAPKAKGPASVGALPDRGSTNSGKEKDMNKAVDTTLVSQAATAITKRRIQDIGDVLSNARNLLEAVFLAAGNIGDRHTTNALQSVIDEIENKLLIVGDRLDELREELA